MPNTLSLDELIALNREVLGLCRAGVPLGPGLARAAQSLSGQASSLAERLAKRLDAGATFDAALEAEGDKLPAVYAAMVRPALRSDRLTESLESFAALATRVASVRRTLLIATIYPLGVLVLAFGLMAFAVVNVLPTYDWIGIDSWALSPTLRWWLVGPPRLSTVVPAVAVLLLAFVWVSSGSADAGALAHGRRLRWLRLPWLGRGYRLASDACFAEMLAVLIKNETPLPDALRLASDAAGERNLQAACDRVAEATASGATPDWRGVPPLVRLALATPAPAETRDRLLDSASLAYRRRADAFGESLDAFLPPAAAGLIGAAAVAVIASLNLGPYIAALYQLALPQ
ncbi:MAG: type II secretion system F family protein [Planctomycetota bacterium]